MDIRPLASAPPLEEENAQADSARENAVASDTWVELVDADTPKLSALLRDEEAKKLVARLNLYSDLPLASGGYGWSQVMECYPFLVQKHALAALSMSNCYRLCSRISSGTQELLMVATGALEDLTSFFNLFCVPLATSLTRSNALAIKSVLGWWLRSVIFEAQSGLNEMTSDWSLVGDEQDSAATTTPTTVKLDDVLEEIRREKHNIKIDMPFDYVLSMTEIDPGLLCQSCHCPAVAPVRSSRNSLLYCAQCLGLELGHGELSARDCTRDPAVDARLDSLETRCPFSPACRLILPRSQVQLHARHCPHSLLLCPHERCNVRCHTCVELIDHVLTCPKLIHDEELKRLERGPFHIVGKDVLQLIMSNLNGKDIVALAQVNRWFSEQVKHLYGNLRCPHCRYFHNGPLQFHSGTWSHLRYMDVVNQRRGIAAARMKDNMAQAATVGKKALIVTLAGVGGAAVGAVLMSPVFLVGFLFRSPYLIAKSLEVPVRLAFFAGSFSATSMGGISAPLTAWTCCKQEGSFAQPCKLCRGPDRDSGGVTTIVEEECRGSEQ